MFIELKIARVFLFTFLLLAPAAAGGASSVRSFAPTGVVPENVSFRVVFVNSVVGRAQVNKTMTPENELFPFTVSPPLALEGRWQSDKIFVARLIEPLRGASHYIATIREGLKDRRGNGLEGEYHFRTEGLKAGDVAASMGPDGNAYFTLKFNQKVNPNRLKGFMRVLDSTGRELAFSINGALPSKTIRASVPVKKISSRQTFTVTISAGLKSVEGELGIDRDVSKNVVLDPELMVHEIGADGENTIGLKFNYGVDPESVKSFVEIDPAVSSAAFESGWNDEILRIRAGEFKPRSRFVITLRKGFPSKGGIVLKEDHRQALVMPDLESEVRIPAEGTYLSPLDKGQVPIELLNVKKLQLDLWRMYDNNIPYVFNKEYSYFDKDIARRVFTKEIALDLPLNERVRKSIPVDEMTGGDRGLYLLTARNADSEWWDETSQLISLSDLGVTVRLWEDAVLVWVNSLTSVSSVGNARVKIFSSKKQLLAEGETNSGGVFYCSRTFEAGNEPALAVISKGADLTYVQLTRNLLNREIFDTSGRDWLKSGYDAAIFSPRDIYRTGETIPFKFIVRNFDVTTPEAFPVMFVVRDSLGRKFEQRAVTLNARGSAAAEITLPTSALTGTWTASITVPGQESKPIGTCKFYVEDFAPPQVEVKLSTNKPVLTRGDVFAADVYARWLFGADGAGLKYRASWSAKEGSFTPTQDRWRGFTFGDPERKFATETGETGDGELDHFGNAKLRLDLNSAWSAPTFIDVSVRTEVQDDTGRWATAVLSRPYWPAPWLLGIAPVSDSSGAFKVAAITPDEEPASPGQLNAQLFRVLWNYNLVEIDGRKRWQSTEELQLVDEKPVTIRNGLGDVAFNPESGGAYLVRISDADDNARAAYRFYAGDGVGETTRLIDRIDMTLDKASYRLGETARITIKPPFKGLLMITTEGAGLLNREVRLADESEVVYKLPITQNMRPNVWVTAWLVRPVNPQDSGQWASHRAIGLAKVAVDVSDFNIDVAIDAPKKAEPATKIPVTLKLTGSSAMINGNAEVAIALVDDGVLGLTGYKVPDLLKHFWGQKKLNSQAFDIYDQLVPVEDRLTEQLHPGGDEGLGAFAPNGNIARFKILSLFDGVVYPDSDGVIKTEFELPEFSGRARLFAVASSGRSFGCNETKIEIARDIVTETGLPRFAAPGDSFVIPVSVFNTSNTPKNVKVKLVPEGLMLDNSFVDLNVPAGGKSSFAVNARALGGADKAALVVETSWDGRSFTQETELPVRAAWPVVSLSGTGTFEDGNTKLDIPLGDFDGKISGTLTLSDTPAVNINQAVNFLKAYPYGCLEQTISAAWPFLILPDAVAGLDPLVIGDDQIREKTQSAINRIQSMQLYNGSFAAWPGTTEPYNWGSVYALHFLLTARDNGVNFPEEMLTGALNWLREFLASMPAFSYDGQEQDDLTAKAYAVYVLALNGEKPLGWIEYLRENEANLRQSGRIYLAGAQAVVDGRADALRNLNIGKFSGYSGMTLESDARNTALLLSMWLDVDPQAPEVTELAMRLVRLRWYSTLENSAAIVALAKYNISASSVKSEIEAKVATETSDEALLTYKSNEGASSMKITDLPKGTGILIEAEGTGQGCYSWNIMGTPKSNPKPERRNLNIVSTLMDSSGNVINFSQPIKQGSKVTMLLDLKPSFVSNNIAVSVLLPAGFEIDDPRLDETESDVVFDVHDDRVVLMFQNLKGERSYGFSLRAVTRGRFKVPQISATGLYDPQIRFVGQLQPDVVIE